MRMYQGYGSIRKRQLPDVPKLQSHWIRYRILVLMEAI